MVEKDCICIEYALLLVFIYNLHIQNKCHCFCFV